MVRTIATIPPEFDRRNTVTLGGPMLMIEIETDERSRVVLPGRPKQKFIVQENSDGSLLLQPARTITEAQLEYDQRPELRELLDRAADSKTVRRARSRAQ